MGSPTCRASVAHGVGGPGYPGLRGSAGGTGSWGLGSRNRMSNPGWSSRAVWPRRRYGPHRGRERDDDLYQVGGAPAGGARVDGDSIDPALLTDSGRGARAAGVPGRRSGYRPRPRSLPVVGGVPHGEVAEPPVRHAIWYTRAASCAAHGLHRPGADRPCQNRRVPGPLGARRKVSIGNFARQYRGVIRHRVHGNAECTGMRPGTAVRYNSMVAGIFPDCESRKIAAILVRQEENRKELAPVGAGPRSVVVVEVA